MGTTGWGPWAENTERRLDGMIDTLNQILATLRRIEERMEQRDAKDEERRRMEWLDGG